jgi:uncharacterized protein (TIGR03067 family)
VSSTIKAESLLAAGQAVATSGISAKSAALTEGVVKAMFMSKLKVIGVVLLLAVGIGIAGILKQGSLADKPAQPEKVNQTKPTAKEGEKLKGDPKKEKLKEDSEQIQGKWVVVSAELAGKPVDEVVGDEVTFDRNKCLIKHVKRNDTDSGTFQLDSSKKPKQIDMKAEGADKPTEGIYELDGDKLKICISDDHADERPTKFATSPERKKLGLLVLKRAKN